MSDLTVFVSTFNRIGTLERCLTLLERQSHPKRIVIVDNGSWHPAAVAYLEEVESQYTIYRMPRIEDVPPLDGDDVAHGGHSMQAVQRNVSACFLREWKTQPRPRWFGMTDADVWLDGPPDSLDAYMHVAEGMNYAVGPHLKLNVHDNYPLRAAAVIQHARILFKEKMEWLDGFPFSRDPIDTTFHLFPASAHFNRLGMETVRIGPPWTATHSDWLIDFCSPTIENHAYILGCGEAASWGGRWLRSFFRAWLNSPEGAFDLLSADVKTHNDYFHSGFMLAWMLQYGHGCQQDVERSKEVMRDAIPDWSPCRDFEDCWDDLVYANDHSCLGW